MKHEHLDEANDRRDGAIDDALKQALRAEDPGAAFTQRVLARAREERAAQQSSRPMHAIGTGHAATEAFARSEVSATSTEVSAPPSEVSAMSSEVSGRSSADTSSEVFEAAALDPSRGESGTRQTTRVRAIRLTTTRKLIAAIAASLTLIAAGAQYVEHRRYVAEGERARAQVLEALRLTNQTLDIVHDQITGRERAR